MIFEPLPLHGAMRIRPERLEDERGYFARTRCDQEFAAAGITIHFVQDSTSFNRKRNTLRGLHWQIAPAAEAKLVRVVRGSVFDVVVDIRPESPTFCRWHGEVLDAREGVQFFIPEGFAHGFLTLEDETEITYQISAPYRSDLARGARFDDPAFQIQWPHVHGAEGPYHQSPRDMAFPLFHVNAA